MYVWNSGVCFSVLFWKFFVFFLLFKQKTAYDMRISDWSSDVCSSDLAAEHDEGTEQRQNAARHQVGAVDRQIEQGRRNGEIAGGDDQEIGSASCRERVCQYV